MLSNNLCTCWTENDFYPFKHNIFQSWWNQLCISKHVISKCFTLNFSKNALSLSKVCSGCIKCVSYEWIILLLHTVLLAVNQILYIHTSGCLSPIINYLLEKGGFECDMSYMHTIYTMVLMPVSFWQPISACDLETRPSCYEDWNMLSNKGMIGRWVQFRVGCSR